jgi:hypothetical protein
MSLSVKTEVCVRKPGPMEELAIKKAAPKLTPPNNLNLDGFDGNAVVFQFVCNDFCKFNSMLTIAVKANGLGNY